ncbi:hypothetical protein D3H55_15320 [Bacillus salacetis]|uniref:Uncharacterized protein n=1 Tax=Bacillus salacetis TaxID=2315464 RepID=A0A3A1QZM7_9BACI|nr:hypothetical protein [Bacillus salacetis]RIW31341.1 hypothetical protein D3H55_15320 [Bacillus salacetis]
MHYKQHTEQSRSQDIIATKKYFLTKEEKSSLHKQLSGSARLFSNEGIKQTLSIANREDWEE